MEDSRRLDIAQLVSEKMMLQQLLEEQEKTVQEQSSQLSQVLGELKDRARALELSQEALSDQTRILQSIVNSIAAGIVVANSEGRLILFNPAAEEIVGVGLTEAMPEEWAERYGCYLPDRVTRFRTEDLPLVRALRGEKVENVYLFIRNFHKPDGIMLLIQASPLVDENGTVKGGVVVFTDVTAKKNMEEALLTSEKRYADLFMGAPDPIIILDKTGCIRSMNPAVERVSGYSESELTGRHFARTGVISERSLPGTIQEFGRVLAGQETEPYEIEIFSRVGEPLTFEAHSRPIRHENEIAGVQVIFRNITARKKFEKRLAVQYAITQVLSESATLAEAAPRILMIICEGLGWDLGVLWRVETGAEVLHSVEIWRRPGLEVPEFESAARSSKLSPGAGLPGRVWAARQSLWVSDITNDVNFARMTAAAKEGLRGAFAFPIRFKNEVAGVLEFFQLQAVSPDEDMLKMFDSVGTQIGQFLYRRQAERKIMEKNVELARTRAEREHLELFAYAASHDLQEPLQKILGFADLLTTDPTAELSPKVRDYLGRMQASAGRMSHLISDLLKFIKITEPQGVREWVDLGKVITEVLADLEHKIQPLGARVETGPLPLIRADGRQMHQLFQNLISNALKFRKEGQTPRIMVTSREAELGFVEIAVQDNGIGFQEKYLDQIFRPFERLHAKEQYAGSGIGLAICKKVVDQHRGTITARSQEGKGATFLIKLPVSGSEQAKSVLEISS